MPRCAAMKYSMLLLFFTLGLPSKFTSKSHACVLLARDELQEYDPFDEGVFCRSRIWLFISYMVSFAAVAGAVWVLLGHYALNPDVTNVWPGVAGLFQVLHYYANDLLTSGIELVSDVRSVSSVLAWAYPTAQSVQPCLKSCTGSVVQVTLILGSALLFFVARTPSAESNYGGYGAF